MTKRVGLYVSYTQNGEVFGLNKKIQYVMPENFFFSVPGMQFCLLVVHQQYLASTIITSRPASHAEQTEQ